MKTFFVGPLPRRALSSGDSREVIEDIDRTSYYTTDERVKAAQNHCRRFCELPRKPSSAAGMTLGEVILSHDSFRQHLLASPHREGTDLQNWFFHVADKGQGLSVDT